MQTKVVIIYSLSQGLRRTTIIPDDDSKVPMHAANLANGEAAMVGELSDYRTMGPDRMLGRYLGRPATTDRCAVVSPAGYVVAVICGDPAIDRHPAGRLHRDPNMVAVVGQPASNLPLLA